MSEVLNRISISGLRGTQSIDLPFEENTLVLVGENGSGKTTLLRLVYALLSGDIHLIQDIDFEEAVVVLSGNSWRVTKDELMRKNSIRVDTLKGRMPLSIYRHIKSLFGDYVSAQALKSEVQSYGFDWAEFDQLLSDSYAQGSLFEMDEPSILDSMPRLAEQIVYLPTYRRIEQDLEQIMAGRYAFEGEGFRSKSRLRRMDSDYGAAGCIELVEFGMDDVKLAIQRMSADLMGYSEGRFKDLAYMNLGDVIDRSYRDEGQIDSSSVSDADVIKFRTCLKRSGTVQLTDDQVNTLLSRIRNNEHPQDAETQILFYYFKRLVSLQDDLENREEKINQFCSICNQYLVDSGKELVYDNASFEIHLFKGSDTVDLSVLSSGEKQVISLFCHIFLKLTKSYFVIIDEPELSLSVPWQRSFLQDVRNHKLCAGLIAATHSPFVYENSLLKYAHGLGEFVR